MAKAKKRTSEVGTIDRGRHTFDRQSHELIRAVIRVKIAQVQRSLDLLSEVIRKTGSPELEGQRDYWANVLSWLNGWYRGGTASVDAVDWLVEWAYVTTVERHRVSGVNPDPHPTIPGME